MERTSSENQGSSMDAGVVRVVCCKYSQPQLTGSKPRIHIRNRRFKLGFFFLTSFQLAYFSTLHFPTIVVVVVVVVVSNPNHSLLFGSKPRIHVRNRRSK